MHPADLYLEGLSEVLQTCTQDARQRVLVGYAVHHHAAAIVTVKVDALGNLTPTPQLEMSAVLLVVQERDISGTGHFT